MFLLLDSGRLGKVTGAKVESERMTGIDVGVIARVVQPNLGILFEEVVVSV